MNFKISSELSKEFTSFHEQISRTLNLWTIWKHSLQIQLQWCSFEIGRLSRCSWSKASSYLGLDPVWWVWVRRRACWPRDGGKIYCLNYRPGTPNEWPPPGSSGHRWFSHTGPLLRSSWFLMQLNLNEKNNVKYSMFDKNVCVDFQSVCSHKMLNNGNNWKPLDFDILCSVINHVWTVSGFDTRLKNTLCTHNKNKIQVSGSPVGWMASVCLPPPPGSKALCLWHVKRLLLLLLLFSTYSPFGSILKCVQSDIISPIQSKLWLTVEWNSEGVHK